MERLSVFFAVLVCVLSCGYGTPVEVTRTAQGMLEGHAVVGPVAQGFVSAYRLDSSLGRGELLSSTTTDGSGAFSLTLPAYSGNVLLVLSSGEYVEDAVGTSVRLDGVELTGVVGGYRAGTNISGLSITPISHWISGLARFYVAKEGLAANDALAEAELHLNAHFGKIDWIRTTPRGLTSGSDAQLDAPARAGLVLGALSMQARGIAENAALTPGGTLNTMSLVAEIYDDLLSDGFFDGQGTSGTLQLPRGDFAKPYKLDGQTVRLSLALAAQRFIISDRNASPFTDADVSQLRSELSRNSNPRIFRGGGSAYDSDAPQVQLAGDAPPPFTQNNAVSFAVIADDGAGTGVGKVFARNGSEANAVPATFEGGLWHFKNLPLRNGRNEIAVWAEDNAAPPNSGARRGAPLELTVPIIFDTTLPGASFVPVASYVDERKLGLQPAGSQAPIPPRYSFPADAAKETIVHLGSVWKAQTRLSWGAQMPTAMELEQGNSANVPYVQLYVAFNEQTDASIAEATYRISVSCSSCSAFPDASGQMIRSARQEPQKVFFDLPLSSETVPALAQVATSPATLTIHATVRDAAGNTADALNAVTVYFHVIGPPLLWAEDTNYPGMGDVRGVHKYKLSDGSYSAVWATTPSILSNGDGSAQSGVRLARFVLKNPHTTPVAVRADAISNSTWSASERWDHETFAHTADFAIDGFSFPWKYIKQGFPDCNTFAEYARHVPGQTRKFECVPLPLPVGGSTAPAVVEGGSLVASSFINPLANGGERSLAPSTTGPDGATYWLVPSAQGTAPGELAVYVERPVRARGYSWGHFGTNFVYAFRVIDWDYYAHYAGPFSCNGGATCYESRAHRFARRLMDATERATGTITFNTSGVRTDGRPLGDLHNSGSMTFERTAQH